MKYRKIGLSCIMILTLAVVCTACSVQKDDRTRLRDVEFTVIDELDIPEELQTQIEKAKKTPFRLTYVDQGYLYMARGYGAQKTDGYSIEVNDCYETENLICVETTLKGPRKEETIQEAETYPYVVLKTEYIEKDVVFE